jgi:hypothetical protein
MRAGGPIELNAVCSRQSRGVILCWHILRAHDTGAMRATEEMSYLVRHYPRVY